ncbi:MAG: hypothetical protein ACYCSN_15480 [Acidobacteriaceae bacterium]
MLRKFLASALVFILAVVCAATPTVQVDAHPVQAWRCTMPMTPNVNGWFSVTAYIGRGRWSTGQQFIVDTGDEAASIGIGVDAAAALHLGGSMHTGATYGVGGSASGYYTQTIVNLCGRVFDGQNTLVLAPVHITQAMDTLAAGTTFDPNLIGAPFLIDNRLSLTVNPVAQTITFAQVRP